MKKYYIFHLNWIATAISLPLGIGVGIMFHYQQWLTTLGSFVAGLLSAIVTDILCTCLINNNKINKLDSEIPKEFFKFLSHILSISEETDEKQKEKKIKDQKYYLKKNNLRTSRTLVFDPDYDSIDLLHKTNGTISITSASPLNWTNPTYNFFLINNYISALKHTINACTTIKQIQFSTDRDTKEFRAFLIRKKTILSDIAALPINQGNELLQYLTQHKESIRFCLLSKDDMSYCKSDLENLLAGHELFGCFLYLVNEEQIPDSQTMKTFLAKIHYDFTANDHKTDFMLAEDNNQMTVIHKKERLLVKSLLGNSDMLQLTGYLKSLCTHILANYDNKDVLFNCDSHDNSNFTKNEKYTLAFMG